MAVTHRSDILFAFAVALALLLGYVARHILLVIYVSILFAVMVTPFVTSIQRLHIRRWHPGRGLAILSILFAGLAAAIVFGTFAFPPIYRDIQELAADHPERVSALVKTLPRLPILRSIDPASLNQYAAEAGGRILKFFAGVAGSLVGFFSFLILTAYFIVDGKQAFHWFIALFPAESAERLRKALVRARNRMCSWLTGQFLLMLILGSSSAVVYGLLGIRYFTVLAVFTGLANIVPVIGPVVSILLAALVAALDSWIGVAGVLIFYLVYQQVENAFLTPRIMKATVNLPALAVVVALAVGGGLAGFLGALVAVPSAALIAVLADEYLVQPHAAEPSPANRPVASTSDR